MSHDNKSNSSFFLGMMIIFLIAGTNFIQYFFVENFISKKPEVKTVIIHKENQKKPDIHKTINKTVNHKTVVNKLSCDKKCKKLLHRMNEKMLKDHIHNDH